MSHETDLEAASRMEPDLTCSKCKESLREPKLLPCLHSFCKSCLEELAGQGQSLTCTNCQYQVILPETGVTGLQNDFQAERFLGAKKLSEKQVCGNRKDCENIATMYCCECDKFLCEQCLQVHKGWGAFRTHCVLTADEVKNNLEKLARNQTPKCETHDQSENRIYCKTCNALICDTCKKTIHENHDTEVVEDNFKTSRDQLEMGLIELKKKLPKVKETLSNCTDTIEVVNNYSLETGRNITKEFGQLQQLLEECMESLTYELKEKTKEEQKKLSIQKDSWERTGTKMSRCLEYTEECLKNGTKGEVVAMKTILVNRISEVTAEFKQGITEPQEWYQIELATNDQAKSALKEFGEIVCDPISAENSYATGDGTKFATKNTEASVEVHPMTEKNRKFALMFTLSGELVFGQATINCDLVEKDGRHIITFKPPNRGMYRLVIQINGRNIKDSPFSIAVAPTLEGLQPIGDLSEPYRAITNSKQQIILYNSSLHKVLVLTREGDIQQQFGHPNLDDKQNKQRSVAVDRDDNIYVTDRVNHRILKFNSNGDFQTAVGSHGSEKLEFKTPIGICCNKELELLYVCDRDNCRIQILTTDLDFVNYLGNGGSGEGQFLSPRYATLDDSNNLYVVDDRNNRVQVFTADGKFLRMFSKKNDKETLISPYAIAVDSYNIVYVSESSSNRISMFTTNGDFIKSYEGMAERPFNKIRGLHIDSNDFLLVSNAKINQLQFFCLN